MGIYHAREHDKNKRHCNGHNQNLLLLDPLDEIDALEQEFIDDEQDKNKENPEIAHA